MKSLISASIFAFLQAAVVSAQEYPSSLNDTTSHTNPFFLQIWSTRNTAYAYQAIGVKPGDGDDWKVVVGQDGAVTGFQLADGVLQLASPEGQHGAADGFGAAFGPETTDGEFISKQFFFTSATNQTRNTWELLNLSNDGLYSILSNDRGPSTFNGFKVCAEEDGTGYYIKYEGSPDGAVSIGCEAIALRTFFGPPF